MGLAASHPSRAASPVAYDLSPRSYADALSAIGVRSNLSLLNVGACRGVAPPLKGSLEARDAIERLLRHAPCRFEFLDAVTVRFTALRSPPRPAAPPPAASPTPTFASQEDSATDLQAVVVTARKRPELLLTSAAALSVVGAARLADVSALDVSDVASQLAAVVLTNLGPGRDKVLLRGVSDGAFTGRARSTVATYLDDAPITYNAPDPDLVLTDVDRIEILRGPQGALYGGGSIGGAYRIVTRPVDLTKYAGAVTVRTSSIAQGGRGSAVEAALNAPLIRDVLGVRAVLYDVDDAGYLQNDETRQSNVDHTRRRGGRLAARLRPANGWTVDASLAIQRLVTGDAQYTTSPKPTLRRANLVREDHVNNFAQAGLTVTGSIGDLALHSATTYFRHSFASRYDASAALSIFDDPLAQFGVYDETFSSRMIVEDVYVATPAGGSVSSLAGVLISHLSTDTPSLLFSRASGSTMTTSLFSEKRHDTVDELGVYGETQVKLSPRWSVTAGGRLFRTSVTTAATTLTPRQAVTSRRLKASDVNIGVSPKLSVQYAAGARTSLYALVSSGERAGGFNTGGLRAATTSQATFKPDLLINYEAGIKARFAGGGEVAASVFHDRWRSIQTDQFLSSGLPYTLNIGSGSLDGAEAEVARSFGPVSLEANALLTRASLEETTPGFAQAKGRALPGAPSLSLAALAEYRRALTPHIDLLLGARATYVGRASLTFDASPIGAVNSAYVDAGLWAHLISGRYRLALTVSNPVDTRANTFAYGNPFTFGQVRQATPQRPRTIELVASAHF
ncbi:N/A [soil metagenome]